MKRRFAKFHNIPELMTMFRSCADIQTKDMLDLVLPKVERETITTKPTAIQREMIKALGERGEKIRNKAVSPDADNMHSSQRAICFRLVCLKKVTLF